MKSLSSLYLAVSVMILLSLQISGVRAGVITEIDPHDMYIIEGHDSTWDPTGHQVLGSLAKIEAFLIASSDPNAKLILKNMARYKIQFWGVDRDGKKVIYCNFFSNFPEPMPGYFRKNEVRSFNGGFYYWQVEYDPATGEVKNFTTS